MKAEKERMVRGDDRNIFLLVRRSLEKPVYKEKLRVRSYGTASFDSQVFVELKKKYESVVYKRRMGLTNGQAMDWLCRGKRPGQLGQIGREIQYVLDFYEEVRPMMYLSYEREAYFGKEDPNFRVTFDEEIRWRTKQISLEKGVFGTPLLSSDQVLMEVKTPFAVPLWMSGWLSRHQVYRTSFSKYGLAYQQMMEARGWSGNPARGITKAS